MGRHASHARAVMQASHFTVSSCGSFATILVSAMASEHATTELPGAVLQPDFMSCILQSHVHLPPAA